VRVSHRAAFACKKSRSFTLLIGDKPHAVFPLKTKTAAQHEQPVQEAVA
jgi:hypothetical protein